ncbi:MAG TPA: electron transporter RnfG [Desulfobacteraceae bacterium]|nr:electron transporter RnfG [Desulfobacteraceae bacterium]
MKEIMRMILVLTVICTVCGVALSALRNATSARIEYQILTNVQGPKVKLVLEGSENDLITDRKKVMVNGKEMLLFIGKKEGKPWAIAYETLGKGFGGEIKVMIGYDILHDKLKGIQIISHKETPGVGARVTEDQFTRNFKGLDIGIKFVPKNDGGDIDAISGATFSSRGVCEAIRKSIAIYPEVKKMVVTS